MRRRELLTILGSAALISPATGGAADAILNPIRLVDESDCRHGGLLT
jgi:hypothetical protein